ncbi:XRE family transcriptional regulator [Paraburkholderia hospita]|uniref:XRE family transcriptional regulator n=1 Tax=Paraburkholderia hospita TaxID=169430 RepID=UPI003ECC3E3D
MHYKPPQPEDIERLKKELGLDGTQMAELFGVAGSRAFRRYTSKSDDTKNKRELGAHMLFFAMARLVLKPRDIEAVLTKMREAGAEIDLSAPSGSPAPDGEQQP